jgi:hypothetical protein
VVVEANKANDLCSCGEGRATKKNGGSNGQWCPDCKAIKEKQKKKAN